MILPRAGLAALLAVAAVVAIPAAATAHSELTSSSPAAGDVLVGGPPVIVGDFSEPVDPGRSSMELRGPDGSPIARGGVPDGGPATRMTITDVPPLEPGRYTVRWTTVTADDAGVERGVFRFAVEAPTAPPAAPTPSPTAPAPPTSGGTPTAAPTAPTAPPATPPPATPTPVAPTAAPADDSPPDAGTGDVLVPLAVLIAVLAGGAAWILRRRS